MSMGPTPLCGHEGRMLVVDDDPRSARLLHSYLESAGYWADVAEDGPSGIRAALATSPDVVFLDVMMPGMTGLEVCKSLKADPRTRLTQIMMVTALAGASERVAGLDIGADDYVTKPVGREEFLARTRALLRARRLLVELEEARHALARRNEELQLKKALAQSLVHDLKNPLAALLGGLDVVSLYVYPKGQLSLDHCRESGQRILQMILNLLDIEAIEEGFLVPQPQLIDLAQLVRSAVDDAARIDPELRLDLNLEARTLPLEADEGLLRRVIDNLLVNAISHSPPGGSIRVSVGTRAEGVELSVADDGPGVPVHERERVFEKYAQLDLHRSGVTANRGLGLTFCSLAVEGHGGTIWIEDAPSGGALFRIVLPASVDVELPEDAVACAGDRVLV